MNDNPTPTAIYVQMTDCGKHIRKWSESPFVGAHRYQRGGRVLSDREEADKQDARVMAAFGQGEACAARGGYRADCKEPYGSERWQAWCEGFDFRTRSMTPATESMEGVGA